MNHETVTLNFAWYTQVILGWIWVVRRHTEVLPPPHTRGQSPIQKALNSLQLANISRRRSLFGLLTKIKLSAALIKWCDVAFTDQVSNKTKWVYVKMLVSACIR